MTPADETFQEQAALFAMGLLPPEEVAEFHAQLRANPALQAYVDELEETVAALAHTAPAPPLPVGLQSRLRHMVYVDEAANRPARLPASAWGGWGLAACLAIACAWFGAQRAGLQQTVAELQQNEALARSSIASLSERVSQLQASEALSRLTIATLSSKLAQAPQATAVVVWDPEKHEGVLKTQHLPKPQGGQDYQLWVIDPQYKQPVSAGVFPVDEPEFTQVAFRADKPITKVQKFAVSLEPKGGAPEVSGPVVMISE